MARLYANENFPLPAIEELRRLGHDVLTTHESGRSNVAMPDEDVLRFAIAEKRVLLTLNRRHFIRLHGEIPDHTRIVVCLVDADFIGQARRIDAALSNAPSPARVLLRVSRPG